MSLLDANNPPSPCVLATMSLLDVSRRSAWHPSPGFDEPKYLSIRSETLRVSWERTFSVVNDTHIVYLARPWCHNVVGEKEVTKCRRAMTKSCHNQV